MSPDLTLLRWRQGRRKGRNVYAQLGPEPDDEDPDIGKFDTPELAAEACEAHNGRIPVVPSGQGELFPRDYWRQNVSPLR